MPAWDRQTPWRQGHVLTDETAALLRLAPDAGQSPTIVVVISHDCDLAQSPEIEPNVEFIVGRRIEALDGNFTNAKNPRRLHLAAFCGDTSVLFELLAGEKRSIAKRDLENHLPNAAVSLPPKNLTILQCWLAARYQRSAFPDEFDRRLKAAGLHDRIAKCVQPLGNDLIAIFFDLDDGREISRQDPDDPYVLRIDLLYSTEAGDPKVHIAVQAAADAISKAFEDRCFTLGVGWKGIELAECAIIADEALTYAQSVHLKKWNADHISLRDEPSGRMLLR